MSIPDTNVDVTRGGCETCLGGCRATYHPARRVGPKATGSAQTDKLKKAQYIVTQLARAQHAPLNRVEQFWLKQQANPDFRYHEPDAR
jgi:hypothetical protein